MNDRLKLGDETREIIEQHFEKGVPLKDIKGISESVVERFNICMELIDIMQQDPTIDERTWLRAVKHRSRTVMYRDLQMLDICIQYMMPQRRARAAYIVERTAIRAIRAGEQNGDIKYQLQGAKLLSEVNRLNEPEEQQAGVGDTYVFAPVLVNVNDMDSTRENLTDDARSRLFAKYKPALDKTQQALQEKINIRREAIEDAEVVEDDPLQTLSEELPDV